MTTQITITGYAVDMGGNEIDATTVGNVYEAVARELFPDAVIVRGQDQHRTFGGAVVRALDTDGDDSDDTRYCEDRINGTVEQRGLL